MVNKVIIVGDIHGRDIWENIHHMNTLYIAEMVCDCVSRSAEFGTDVRQWFSEKASVKYNFTLEDKVYKDICYFLDLLLEKSFI